MRTSSTTIRSLFAAAAFMAMTATAVQAADDPAKPAPATRQCFFSQQWSGWHAPDAKTLYLRVNMNEVWRVDLNSECHMLTSPGVHLVTKIRGSSSICSAIDLDLSVADTMGMKEPCFVKEVRQLTKDEVAAIPKKDLP